MEKQFHFMEKQSHFPFQFENLILTIVSLYGP